MSSYSSDDLTDQAPNDISFETNLFSVNFHPTDDLVVVSDAEGRVKLFKYGLEENKSMFALRPHKSGCREACFSTDGKYIFTASSDCSMKVIDVNTGSVLYTREEAHDDAINTLISKDFMVFTGDDEGTVKVWDMRQQNIVCEFQEHADYISDIITINDRHVVATSGDGGLSIYNFVRRSLDDISEKTDNELLSVASLENDQTLVCGTQDGTILIFDIHNLETPKKFVGHPQSVDSIVKVSNDSFLSGSSDGMIRYVGIKPRKLLGVIGEHSTFPVERIAISRDNRYLGSISHDLSLKFWNVSNLYDDEVDEDDEQMDQDESNDADSVDYENEGQDNEDEELTDDSDDNMDDSDNDDDKDSDDSDSDDSDDDSSDDNKKVRKSRAARKKEAKKEWTNAPNKEKKKKKNFFNDL
ncbi:WD40 repeat-containing protein [Heterostelium album PN500]|uniref:WD40 repeat-containing protein n=1 Tax=Heterostelium pallidum (strain ATCC 26659 / Pp 5 / PN500) TaxID=670386 RepID=D3AXI5_HETP5|nr:WD40 repeat-containing protein [Heterostelium album PN500]EFA86254.1 WD40 repeat-containing protein [Heterostelium album PN500]|eukprot:XP_020438359.1 WD40 repeat-containing protein [Heterostelium album PN500]